jgi:demethylmenaquinone methyltransferase/2-methoxy-6-polyprenyl-1,4-benzoquinol methylase
MSPSCRLNVRERLSDPQQKRELNEQLFGVVAPRYDAITRLLSCGRDRAWKAALVDALPPQAAPVCLDVACGTGDITFLLAARYPDGRIIGLDLSPAMLDRARARCTTARIEFRRSDMGRTGLDSGSVDIVTGGYALRNAGDLGEALAEIHRVLRPGGLACFLDFSKPPGRALQRAEGLLLRFWGGLWGWILHGDPSVYTYIAESLARFPDRRQLVSILQTHGFEVQSDRLFFGGIVQRLTVRKSGPVRRLPAEPDPA